MQTSAINTARAREKTRARAEYGTLAYTHGINVANFDKDFVKGKKILFLNAVAYHNIFCT